MVISEAAVWRRGRDDVVWPHHLVVLVFEQVAVPYVATRVAFKLCYDARNHPRMRLNCIFPSRLVSRTRHRRANVSDRSIFVVILWLKGATVQNLEPDRVQVDRVRIVGKIHESPDFH